MFSKRTSFIVFFSLFSLLILLVYEQIWRIKKIETPFPKSTLYVSGNAQTKATVIRLGGAAERETSSNLSPESKYLVQQGYAILNLCYYDCDLEKAENNLGLIRVDLKLVLDAIGWVKEQSLSDQKVILYGFSRGAELAMLIAGLNTDLSTKPDAIIIHAPTDETVGPWNKYWRRSECWSCSISNCEGVENRKYLKWNSSCPAPDPNSMNFQLSPWVFENQILPVKKRIEIEKFDRPIFISVGLRDHIWPVERILRIERVLSGRKDVELQKYENQGHIFDEFAEASRQRSVYIFLENLKNQYHK